MRRVLKIVAVIAAALGAVVSGVIIESASSTWVAHRQERAVAALPGVGQGWLDTLRAIAGDVQIDTITALEFYDDGPHLLGLFEPWHGIISVNVDMPEYFGFQRAVCGMKSFGYVHPVTLATPAGVLAHEFGHRFRFSLWPHGIPGYERDTLPAYAQDEYEEEFADRFSRAMMALRGWDTPDSADAVLTHRVRYLLIRSRWAAEM